MIFNLETYKEIEGEIDELFLNSFYSDYIKRCNTIRVGNLSGFYAESYHKPTKEQIATLIGFLKEEKSGQFYKTDSECDMDIKRPMDVQRWSSWCW